MKLYKRVRSNLRSLGNTVEDNLGTLLGLLFLVVFISLGFWWFVKLVSVCSETLPWWVCIFMFSK